MQFERFDSIDSFSESIKNGINLFLGSGFSVEAFDEEDKRLPIGNGLLNELKDEFPAIKSFSSLSMASTILESTTKEEFYRYLSKRFCVKNFSEKYNALVKLNLKNIYTTNIDDLLFYIFENSKEKYLNNTAIRGACLGTKNAVNYSPLHGCVRNPEKGYIFSKTKIASVFTDQRDIWNSLRQTISKDPILFWGWSFEDSDAIEAMFSNRGGIDKNTSKWVVLYKPKQEEIWFYEALGFNIIISDTINLLKYFDEQIISENKDILSDLHLPQYSIPIYDKGLASYPLSSFFEGDAPRWSHIYSGEIAKTHHFTNIKNDIDAEKNIFVIGIPASGKTTLCMQLLAECNATNKHKHFIIGPTLEEAQKYVKQINNEPVLLFVDSCFRDVEAILHLISQNNIQLIGFDRDYLYEANSFRFKSSNDYNYSVIDVTEINDLDKRRILDSIPNDSKIRHTTIRGNDSTIFSLLSKNLKGPRFDLKFKKTVNDLYKSNKIATELFVMICYVHSCGVPVSFDMIYSYLRDIETDYIKIYDIISQVGRIIVECSDETFGFLNVNFDEQDYYQSRSRYFAELIIKNIPSNCPVLKDVLFTFIQNVPSFKICEYDVFKRKGFDADFTTKAFTDISDGIKYYTLAAEIDETEYLFQQAALYFSRKKEHSLAFQWIDKARNITSYNKFSIDNTHAIIQFNANKDVEDVDGSIKELLKESLEKLIKCYENDRRKATHVKSFAFLSLEFHNRYGYEGSVGFLELANDWIEIELESLDIGLKLKNEFRELNTKIEKILNY